MSSAAVEMLRALLAEGWDIDYVRVSDPHAAAILHEGLLTADQIQAELLPGRIVLYTVDGVMFDAVISQ